MSRELNEKVLVGESWDYFSRHLATLSPRTKETYLIYFPMFLEYLEMDSDQLLEKVKEGIHPNAETRDRLWLGHRLADYQLYLMENLDYKVEVRRGPRTEVYPTKTTLFPVTATITFLKANGIEGVSTNGIRETRSERIPLVEKDQLIQIVEATGNYRNKAIIYTMRDSGLRIGDIALLTCGMIQPVLDDPDLEFFHMHLKEQEKTGNPADPVLGPECLHWIREWVKWREDHGIPLVSDGPLFCTTKKVKPFSRTYGEGEKRTSEGTEKGEWLDANNISIMFSQNVRKAGLKKDEQGQRTRISAHSVRKYHTTYGTLGRIPERWLNVMQGKKGTGTQGIYQQPNAEMLLEAFREGYHALAFYPPWITSEIDPERVEGLEGRLANLEKTNQFFLERLRENKDVVATTKITHDQTGLDITDQLLEGYTVKEAVEIAKIKAEGKADDNGESEKDKKIENLETQVSELVEMMKKLMGEKTK